MEVGGYDNQREYRAARSLIGLVPQELTTDAFESVWNTVSFSRGLYGKTRDDAKIETILRRLTLWEKRNSRMMELSGGMKRRVMIAKALSHEPAILFLDEPTAGVDVELRRDMWELVRKLRADGTTVILTTHYIEEAEEMADRVGVIRKGQLVALGDTSALMKQMGTKTLKIALEPPLPALPAGLEEWGATLEDDGQTLCYRFDSHAEETGISALMQKLAALGVGFKDLSTEQSSLEDIFVSLVHARRGASGMNLAGVKAIYVFEMARARRTLWQSLVAPVITTSLYFLVFGTAIGSRMSAMNGVDYGSFIVPGLIMLSVLTQSIFNASFGIYFPKFTGTIYETLSAPISPFEIVSGLCRRGDDQGVRAGAGDARHRRAAGRRQHRPPDPDAGLPRGDIGGLLPAGLRDRDLGQEFRAVAGRALARGDAADLPRRGVLLGLGARRAVAHGDPAQPDPLPRVGVPLDLLRDGRRAAAGERGRDGRGDPAPAGRDRVDFSYRVSAQELASGAAGLRSLAGAQPYIPASAWTRLRGLSPPGRRGWRPARRGSARRSPS